MSSVQLNDRATERPFSWRGVEAAGAAVVSDSAGGVVAMAQADTTYPVGTRVAVSATAAGDIQFTFENGSTGIFPVAVGLTLLPFRVRQWNAAETTAQVSSVQNLI